MIEMYSNISMQCSFECVFFQVISEKVQYLPEVLAGNMHLLTEIQQKCSLGKYRFQDCSSQDGYQVLWIKDFVELQILLENASYISRLIEKEFAKVPVVISSQNLSSAGVRPGLVFITPVL